MDLDERLVIKISIKCIAAKLYFTSDMIHAAQVNGWSCHCAETALKGVGVS